MEEIFETCKYVFKGKMSQLPAMSERLLSPAEIALHYQTATNPVAGLVGLVQTDLSAPMLGENASAFLRVPFVVTNLAELDRLTLHLRYNDGFIAYLNGQEVARANLGTPGTPVSWAMVASRVVIAR